MYRVMRYDRFAGWVEAGKYPDYTQALIVATDYKRLSPDEQFDITYTPSKSKKRKKVASL